MKKITAFVICLLFLLSLLFTSCTNNDPLAPVQGIINANLGDIPSSLDPAYCSDTAAGSIILHIFEGLMSFDKENKPVLAQAQSYNVSDDGLIYTFTLRDGLKWSDGRTVSSGDYSYAWNRAASVESGRGSAYLFENIARTKNGGLDLETPDDKTLIVKLSAPLPYFTELLALPAFCPVRRDVVQSNSGGWSVKAGTCIGNGAYALKEIIAASHISLEINNNYRDAASVKIKSLNFVNISGGTAYDAYLNGDIQFADIIANTKISEAKQQAGFKNTPQYGSYYLIFNTLEEPFDSPLVREALCLAIDRESMNNDICLGTNSPAGALVAPGVKSGSAEYRREHDEFIKTSDYKKNLERARELLAEAGYPQGEGFPVIEYSCATGNEHLLIAEAIQHIWAEIGVTMSIKAIEHSELLSAGRSGSFQIMRSGWMNDYNDPVSSLSVFTSESERNFSGWESEEYDKYINDSFALSGEERTSLLYKAEELLFSEWLICPLLYSSDIYLQNTYLENVIVSPLGYKSFVYAQLAGDDRL